MSGNQFSCMPAPGGGVLIALGGEHGGISTTLTREAALQMACNLLNMAGVEVATFSDGTLHLPPVIQARTES